MAYSAADWEVARAFFERGLSLNEIIRRDEVKIKSKSQIQKKSVAEKWEKNGEKKQVLEKEIVLKQEVAEIKRIKDTFSKNEREINDTLLEEKIRNVSFYNGAQNHLANVALAMINKKLDSKGRPTDELTPIELNVASNVISKSREGVVGKAPEVAIQINNGFESVLTRVRRD